MLLRLVTVLTCFSAAIIPAPPLFAQSRPLNVEEVPAPLKPWADWVTYGNPTLGCSWVDDARVCVWPGLLSLRLEESGGTFTQEVDVQGRVALALPGGPKAWPRDARANGAPIPIADVNGTPTVLLTPGRYRIEGRFDWPVPPEQLPVPPEVARVTLLLDGVAVERVRRDELGAVFLRGRAVQEDAQDHLNLEVYRRIDDGMPLRMTTELLVRAAGNPRELRLPSMLVAQTLPTEVESTTLPVRLDRDGALTIQLRAGSHRIRIVALLGSAEGALQPPSLAAPWPEQEVWCWAANEQFRQVELSGGRSIDPSRTNLPEDWKALPAYVMSASDVLQLKTTRKGEPTPPANELNLTRDLWINLDGVGYTVRDSLSGQVQRHWRLNLEEGELGRVSLRGEDQLVTLDRYPGVEVRQGNLEMKAEWQGKGSTRKIPAVGWSEDVRFLRATLHLPPGWSLFHATGVDEARTWTSMWNVWAFFYVLILTVAAARLYGIRWGAVAALFLVASYHEYDAPLAVWAVFLGLVAIHRVLSNPVLRRLIMAGYWIALLALWLLGAFFASEQLKIALFPQVSDRDGTDGSLVASLVDAGVSEFEPQPENHNGPEFEDSESAAGGAPSAPAAESEASRSGLGILGSLTSKSAPGGQGASTNMYMGRAGWSDPNAIVQTGPGLPNWSFSQVALRWSGPVARGDHFGLWLAPPAATRGLALLRVALLGLLIGLFWAARPKERPASSTPTPKTPGRPDNQAGEEAPSEEAKNTETLGPHGTLPEAPTSEVAPPMSRRPDIPRLTRNPVVFSLLALVAFTFGPATLARGQSFPDTALLQELGTRLSATPSCAGPCASLQELTLTIVDNSLSLDAVVHAEIDSAVPLPGPVDSWTPDAVRLDQQPWTALRRADNGFLLLRVPAGVHRVQLTSTLTTSAMTLAFAVKPRRLAVSASGWDVDGVRENGEVGESIQLTKHVPEATPASSKQSDSAALPVWFSVTRQIEAHIRWTVTTTVRRLTPATSPEVLKVALMPGEGVEDPSLQVKNGQALVSFGRTDVEKSWSSVMEPRESLALKAPSPDTRRSETWILSCSPIWRCEMEGISPSSQVSEGIWQPIFEPFPGDEVTFNFRRPEAAPGQSTTLDDIKYTLSPGRRITSAQLAVNVRSSTGGPYHFTLPKGARNVALLVGGEKRPVKIEGQDLTVSLQPGSQGMQLSWEQPEGISLVYRAPRVRIEGHAVNATVLIKPGSNRWLLWTGGPAWGPAVLFWPYVLLLIGIAFLLGRSALSPLTTANWTLLGLGLTSLPAFIALFVVGWFFAMAYRRQHPELPPQWFDLRQLALVGYTFLALVALCAAVVIGLRFDPDIMLLGGDQSSLRWYVDRFDGALPEPWIISAPIWVYRLVMLSWALWLATQFLRWVRWGWECFTEGAVWKALPAPKRAPTRPASAGSQSVGGKPQGPGPGTAPGAGSST